MALISASSQMLSSAASNASSSYANGGVFVLLVSSARASPSSFSISAFELRMIPMSFSCSSLNTTHFAASCFFITRIASSTFESFCWYRLSLHAMLSRAVSNFFNFSARPAFIFPDASVSWPSLSSADSALSRRTTLSDSFAYAIFCSSSPSIFSNILALLDSFASLSARTFFSARAFSKVCASSFRLLPLCTTEGIRPNSLTMLAES
mmetsp:Transcript_14165/g.23982  ORF Transcript_14165/g.23982 Transcript_14165/m.23982 type:complete len:208 (+) Transcript_14165:644-1267(+)